MMIYDKIEKLRDKLRPLAKDENELNDTIMNNISDLMIENGHDAVEFKKNGIYYVGGKNNYDMDDYFSYCKKCSFQIEITIDYSKNPSIFHINSDIDQKCLAKH